MADSVGDGPEQLTALLSLESVSRTMNSSALGTTRRRSRNRVTRNLLPPRFRLVDALGPISSNPTYPPEQSVKATAATICEGRFCD